MTWLRRRLGTVRGRMTALAVVAVAAALLVAAVALVVLQRRVLTDALDARLGQRVSDLSSTIGRGENAPALVASTIGDDTVIQIVALDGAVLASTDNAENDHPLVAPRSQGGTVEFSNVGRVEIADHDVSLRVAVASATTPAGEQLTVIAGAPDESIRESVTALTRGLAIATPALIGVLGLLVWRTTKRALEPVEAMRARADRIGATELDERVPTTGTGDEIDRLAHTMNRMLGRLQVSSEQQRDFVADASHELRTPLTGIIAQLEAARPAMDLEVHRETNDTVLTEAHRMRRLVEDLLVLARSDNGSRPWRATELVDIDDIVLEEVRGHEIRGFDIDTRQVSGGQVRANADEIRRIVRNLVDNAVRFASSRVAVEVSETTDEVHLVVGDDGPGIAAADREKVFDRFVRLDTARARTAGGTGLGLAISRALTERYGGRISVDESPMGGARFTVALPLPAGPGRGHSPAPSRKRATASQNSAGSSMNG